MRWRWGRRVEEPIGQDVVEHQERAEEALYKARADAPRIADLTDEISKKIEENQWSPKIAAAFKVGPRRG